jgi:hypothetical protein
MRRAAVGNATFRSKLEQPLTRQLHTPRHGLADHFEVVFPLRKRRSRGPGGEWVGTRRRLQKARTIERRKQPDLKFLDISERKAEKKFSIVGVLAMANSRSTGPLGARTSRRGPALIPARTPGPLGRLDAGDPDIWAKVGDTPRSLGVHHHAGPTRRFTRGHHISKAGQKAVEGAGVSSVGLHVVRRRPERDGLPAQKRRPQPESAMSRLQMAQWIVNQEARRDRQGRLKVYNLPANDGGGRFEVAGINERYDTGKCLQLVAMLNAGQYAAAEREAAQYIALQTDAAAKWTRLPAAELFLRDTIFNRGLGGATKILQMALGGVARSQIATAVLQAEQNPKVFIERLRAAREEYEWKVVGRRANFVAGLTNRWNHARDEALKLIT